MHILAGRILLILVVFSICTTPLVAQSTDSSYYFHPQYYLPKEAAIAYYDRYTAETQMDIWGMYRLIRPAQIKQLHKIYGAQCIDMFIKGLTSGKAIYVYCKLDDYVGETCRQDRNIIFDLLKEIAVDRQDTMEWLCNRLLGNITVSIGNVQIDYIYDREVFEYAEQYKVKLSIDSCMARICGTPGEDPVSGSIYLYNNGKEGLHALSYLLSLGDKTLNEKVRERIKDLYKEADKGMLSKSEEYREFKQHGVTF